MSSERKNNAFGVYVSYSGNPFRRISSATVSAKPVIVAGCSRLQFFLQLPSSAHLMQVVLLRWRSACRAASSAMSLAVLKSRILGM